MLTQEEDLLASVFGCAKGSTHKGGTCQDRIPRGSMRGSVVKIWHDFPYLSF
jgi:hypothetical protein